MVDDNRYYSINALIKMRVFPWVKSNKSLAKWIAQYPEKFSVLTKGTANGTRYLIKGSTVNDILTGRILLNQSIKVETREGLQDIYN